MIWVSSAKSYLNSHVNIHLTNGDVIVNVVPLEIIKPDFRKELKLENGQSVQLRDIQSIDTINERLLMI